MSNNYTLNVTPREQTGRSASRRVRKANQVPAILYGKHTNPETLAIDAPEFTRLYKSLRGRALIVELTREGKGDKSLSFLQEVQRDPITDRFLHIDLQEVKADEKMEIRVPINLVGEAYGVKTEGGVLETSTHALRIRCLPKDLPEFIDIDVTELKVGNTIKVAALKPIAGVEFRDLPGQPIVSCLQVEGDAAAEPAAGAAPAAAAAAAAPAAAAAAAAPAKK